MNSPLYQAGYSINLHLSSAHDRRPNPDLSNHKPPSQNTLPQRKMSCHEPSMATLQLPGKEPGYLRKTLGSGNTLEVSTSSRRLDFPFRNNHFELNSPLFNGSKLSPAVDHDLRQHSQQKNAPLSARRAPAEEKEHQRAQENAGSNYNKIMEKIDKKERLIQELRKLSSFKITEQIKHEHDRLSGREQGHELKVNHPIVSAQNSPVNLNTSISKRQGLNKSSVNDNSKNIGSYTYLKEKIAANVAATEEMDYKITIKNPEDLSKKGRMPFYTPKGNKAGTETKIENSYTPKIVSTKLLEEHLKNSAVKIPEKSMTNLYKDLGSPMPKLPVKSTMQSMPQHKTIKEVKDIQQRSRKASFADKKLSISDFTLGKSLGQGKFGTVYQAIHKETNFLVALKKISKVSITSSYMIDQFLMEIKIQSFCHHENILKLYGFFDDKEHIYLVLEYMEEGTLFGVLKKNKTLGEEAAAEKLRQVAEAVNYLHDKGIAHRDIKPENIVISNGVGKLCDLGWAAVCNERRKTHCGTFDYAAPEILEGEEYDMSVDLWCMGVLAYELLVGKAPFYHISRKETMKRILNVESHAVVYPAGMSAKAVSFIDKLIKRKPEDRMAAEEVLRHPFLARTLEK